jgi:hypothetical protein
MRSTTSLFPGDSGSKHLTIHTAKWVVPVTSPIIENGGIVTSGGRIVQAGRFQDLARSFTGKVNDHGESIIFPALVNTHTHLDLSFLKGCIPARIGFAGWLEKIVSLISDSQNVDKGQEKLSAIHAAINELSSYLSIAVGDIGNTPFAMETSMTTPSHSLYGVFFREIICPGPPDFTEDELEGILCATRQPLPEKQTHFIPIRSAISAHAPYSTGQEAIKLIKKTNSRHGLPFSIHAAESNEEREYMEAGKGQLCDFLSEKRGTDAGPMSPGISSIRLLHKL